MKRSAARRRKLQQRAARAIQRWFREYRARFEARSVAAVRVQHAWRGWRAARSAAQLAASLLIQRNSRGVLVRRNLEEEGVLILLTERCDPSGVKIACAAHRDLQRTGPRGLAPRGWALVVSAGGSQRNPNWRAVLKVSEDEAVSHFSRKVSTQEGKQDVKVAAKQPHPTEVAQDLLDDLVVNLSNGQLSLHLASKDFKFDDHREIGNAASDVGKHILEDMTTARELEVTTGADTTTCVLQGISAVTNAETPATLYSGTNVARVESADVVGGDGSVIARCMGTGNSDPSNLVDQRDDSQIDSVSAMASCAAWCCLNCGLNNEVSPEICVLCESKRSSGPRRGNARNVGTRPPSARPSGRSRGRGS